MPTRSGATHLCMGPNNALEQINREGHQRLYPSITNPNWLVLRSRRVIFERWVQQLPLTNLTVLDVGGRIQPYRPLLADRLGKYVAIDPMCTPLVNIIGRAEALPFPSDHFDLAICTQVMQYIPDPALFVREIARVIKPGGFFWLSAPSAYPIDKEGEEYWRFLPAGLQLLLTPFRQIEIVAEGGTFAGLLRTSCTCLNLFAHYSVMKWLFRYSVFPAMNAMGALLEMASGSRNQQFAVNYSVLARR